MEAARHSKILQHLLNEQNISDLLVESPERQLEMYRLALVKVREQVEKRLAKAIPLNTLRESEGVLDELSIAFARLSTKSSLRSYKIEEEVLPLIEEALDAVSRAVDKREKANNENAQAELPDGYLPNVIRFRRLIIQLCEYLQPSP